MRGLRTRPFDAARVTAIDVDPAMVAKARRRLTAYGHRVSVNSGDVTDIGHPNESFDVVFNFAVLHHVPDWKAAVDDIARVLVVGGIFFSQDHDVANHDWLSRHPVSPSPGPFHQRRVPRPAGGRPPRGDRRRRPARSPARRGPQGRLTGVVLTPSRVRSAGGLRCRNDARPRGSPSFVSGQ